MQADLVLGAKRSVQHGLWVLRSGCTPDSEHFCCQQQCSPTCAFDKHVFLPWGLKYTVQSGLVVRVTPKSAQVSLLIKAMGRKKYFVVAVMDTLKSLITHRKQIQIVKKFLK